MTKQKISWKETWRIYWLHYINVNKYTGLVLLAIYLPAAIIAKHFDTNLIQILKQPHYAIPFAFAILLIQLFPINLYVLKKKTLPAKYQGFHIYLQRDKETE